MARFFCCSGLFRPSISTMNSSLYGIITRNAVLILVYYILSIGLTFYQSSLVKKIHFPLIVVLCHFIVKFLLSSFIRVSNEIWTKKHRVLLDCSTWVKRLSLVGLPGGLDVGLSNWSQELITVSLYTMSKSTAIIFILGFALALKLEEKHWSLIVIVSMISSGLFMFTYKSTQFEMEGFLLVLAASFLSGLRWSMTQLVVQKSTLGLQNPIDMVYHVQPWMIVAVVPFAIFFEGPQILQQSIPFETPEEKAAVFGVVVSVLIGAIMAFCMEIAEYLVITYTSSLTFSVAGIFKEVCTLCIAVRWNGDEMTFINFIGLLTCMVGIICHVVFKFAMSANALKDPVSLSPNRNNILSPRQMSKGGRNQMDPSSNHHDRDDDRNGLYDDELTRTDDNLPLLRNYSKPEDLRFAFAGSDEDSDDNENVIWRA